MKLNSTTSKTSYTSLVSTASWQLIPIKPRSRSTSLEPTSESNQSKLAYLAYGLSSKDKTLKKEDDSSFYVRLNVSFKYFSSFYSGLYISDDGLVSFFKFTGYIHQIRTLPIKFSPLICAFCTGNTNKLFCKVNHI